MALLDGNRLGHAWDGRLAVFGTRERVTAPAALPHKIRPGHGGRSPGLLMVCSGVRFPSFEYRGSWPGLRPVPELPRFVWHVTDRAKSHC
jgi:hypothetical protein